MSLVLAVAALTQAQRGRVQAATDDCAEATRLLDAMDDFVPWYVAEVRIVLARAALRLSDVVGARALVEGAALAVRATPDAPVLAAWLEDASAQVEAYSTSAIVAPATLTTAELRILALLPTHLSLPRDGLAALRVAQHGQDAGSGGLPQARRVLALRGRCSRARAGPPRALADSGAADRDVPARPRVGRIAGDPRPREVVVEVRQLDERGPAGPLRRGRTRSAGCRARRTRRPGGVSRSKAASSNGRHALTAAARSCVRRRVLEHVVQPRERLRVRRHRRRRPARGARRSAGRVDRAAEHGCSARRFARWLRPWLATRARGGGGWARGLVADAVERPPRSVG